MNFFGQAFFYHFFIYHCSFPVAQNGARDYTFGTLFGTTWVTCFAEDGHCLIESLYIWIFFCFGSVVCHMHLNNNFG